MDVVVKHLGGTRFEATARGNSVISDQPVSNGGTDTGMTPPEFLLTALGTCAGYYAAEYLRTRGLPDAGLTVRVSAEKALKPARLAGFRIEVDAPATDERHLRGIERAVHACLVHNTLLSPPTIETVVRSALVQTAAIPVAA